MNPEEAKKRLEQEKDFICIKRFDYSLKKLLERYSEGAPIHVICQALLMTEEEVEKLYSNILVKLRNVIK